MFVSTIQQNESAICLHISWPPPLECLFRSPCALGRVPCATQYGLSRVSIPVSQFLPSPALSSLVAIYLFSTSVSVSQIRSSIPFFQILHMCLIYDIFLFLTYFHLFDTLKYIHISANDSTSFFFMAEWYSILSIYHIFFIHSKIHGYLGCFHVLVIVNILL